MGNKDVYIDYREHQLLGLLHMSSERQETDELTLEPFKEGDDKDGELDKQFTSVKGKRIMVIGGVIAALLLVVFLFYYFGEDDTKVASTKQASPQQKTSQATYIYEMPEIVTNLAPNNEQDRWIKIGITMQLENSKDQASLDKKLPMIKDTIIVFLRELRESDLASSGGSMMLKNELLKRINKIMYPIKLRDVLLREILLDR